MRGVNYDDATRFGRISIDAWWRTTVMIAARSGLDAAMLGEIISQIFKRHDMEPPMGLPHPFDGWAEPMRQMAETAGQPGDFLAGYDGVVALFDPVLSGEVVSGTWDATHRHWQDSANGHPPLFGPA
jgi:hypothetical protein